MCILQNFRFLCFSDPKHPIHGGVFRHADGKTVTAPVLMWVEALDLVLQRLKDEGVDFSKVSALSGGGQVCPFF